MDILLCSADVTVLQRWTDLLDKYSLQQAISVSSLKQICTDKKIDMILLHRSLVDVDTFTEIRRSFNAVRIMLLSDRPDEEEGLTFVKLGISGYANTYISPERLTEAVSVISHGAVWLGQILQNKDKVNEILSLSDMFELMAVLALGHPQHRNQKSQRKPFADFILQEIGGDQE